MKTILKNKWHLHAIIGAISTIALMYLLSFSDSLRWFESWFVAIFILFCVACLWEWGQNLFYKADQSTETSKGDVIASVIGGVIGILIYFIF